MHSAFTKILNIQRPIVGAPMFIVSGVDLVVAVSEAGGLGSLPSLNARSSEELDRILTEIEAKTAKAYAVNLVLKDNPRLQPDLEVCLAHHPAAFITSLGDPAEIVKRAHDQGIKVISDVVREKHAAKAVQSGADALIAVCAGAGGHAGKISPFVLVPLLVQSFAVPVLMAGGVADGSALAAALMLGASGVSVGTRLLASHEALAQPEYLQAIIDADSEGVEYTDEVTGVSASFLRVSLEAMRRGEIGKGQRFKHIWSAGQNVALIDKLRSAGDIVREMDQEAGKILARAAARKS